jgi:hypothetical protein
VIIKSKIINKPKQRKNKDNIKRKNRKPIK